MVTLGPQSPSDIDYSSIFKKGELCQVWWCTLVIPALGKLRQEDQRFKASLGYIVRIVVQLEEKQDSTHSCMEFDVATTLEKE
jgi:hypothetical protein